MSTALDEKAPGKGSSTGTGAPAGMGKSRSAPIHTPSPQEIRSGIDQLEQHANDPKNATNPQRPSGRMRGLRDKIKSADPREKIKNLDPRNKLRQLDPRQRLNNMRQQLNTLAKDALKKAAKEALKKAATAAASNPVVLIVLVVVGVVLIIIFSIVGGGSTDPNAPLLTLQKSGPTQSAKDEILPYQIKVAYPGTAQDIVVQDQIPQGTEYIDSNPPAKFDPATRIATWSLKDFVASQSGILASPSATLSINLRATDDDSYIVNQAQGSVIGAGSLPINNSNSSGGYLPPNDDTCGDKYDITSNTLLPKNFGDPSCSITKDEVYTRLKEKDPANADWWFYQVLPCESGYNPNSWRDPNLVPHTPDPQGAWGLVQDGSSTPPGQDASVEAKGGLHDRGDVNWPIQIDNAVELLKERGKGYWGCA